MVSLLGTQSQATHDETFEMILPPATESITPKNPVTNTAIPSPQRTRTTDKNTASPSNTRSIARIAIAVAVGAVSGIFVGGVVSRDAIQELRSEFKRDLDSFRDEVKHELGVHSFATAVAVQTVVTERATEFQHQNIESIGNLETTQEEAGIGAKKDPHDSSLLNGKSCNHLLDDGSDLRKGRIQLSDIFPNEWTDTIRGWIHATKITATAAYDSIRQKIVRLLDLQSDDIIADLLDWIQNTNLLPTIDLDSLALRDPFEDGIFFSAILRLVLLLLLSFCVMYDRFRDRFIDFYHSVGGMNKAHDGDSSNTVRDDKNSNECQDSGPEENIPDLVEAKEDLIMEQVFHDSVAAAMKLPGLPHVEASGEPNDDGYPCAFASSTSRSLPQPAPRIKISRKERFRQARINAQAFGARDALKLSNAAGVSTTTAKRPPVFKSSKTAPSPWHVNQQRIERARANAKLFGERDKERIKRATMDSPWKRKQNTRSNVLE